MEIEKILAYNKQYVAHRGYEEHITDKYPSRQLAILTCMDTRLTRLLPDALGLRNGDAKIIKNAGGLILSPFDSAMRSLLVAIYELGVKEVMVVHHSGCGACHMSFAHLRQAMEERGISTEDIRRAEAMGVDLHEWLEGFHDTRRSVLSTVDAIRRHPLIPRDLIVEGFIIDSTTGALERV